MVGLLHQKRYKRGRKLSGKQPCFAGGTPLNIYNTLTTLLRNETASDTYVFNILLHWITLEIFAGHVVNPEKINLNLLLILTGTNVMRSLLV